ncbi:Putative ubiquinone biosynthesis monooxygenase COQ6-like Protein [Tribolium castaneum]|uniref:Ubiquinone biosynthesis monooxygenase COQ6-like Protein n=1 Tax=Tribolium castaneum TaxID=7070 RepID=A0A139WFD9_TRICA|nr:Putative ubiquinone biosynthesis monooxygenase COQ6-like Protein [Tribolium castaneum]
MLIKQFHRKFINQHTILLARRFQSTHDISCKHYDVIVAGGGMVGTTLACTLGKNPKLAQKKILLLEGSKQSSWKLPEAYSNRVSALNAATFELLNDIDAWKHIAGARFGPVKRMQVWDAMSDAAISFDHDNLEKPVAYVVENDVLLDAVRQEMENVKTVEVLYESKIQTCSHCNTEEDLVTVCMENGAKYTCELVVS